MSNSIVSMIFDSFLETLVMVFISGGIGTVLGIPLGIVLFVTDKKSLQPRRLFMPKPSNSCASEA